MIETEKDEAAANFNIKLHQAFRIVGCLVVIVMGLGVGAFVAYIVSFAVGLIQIC